MPVHNAQHAGHGVERRIEPRPFRPLRQHAQGGTDDAVISLELARDRAEVLVQRYAPRPRHQEAEGHALGVSVREVVVRPFGEQQLADVLGQPRQPLRALRHLLFHLLAQESAQPRAGGGELPDVARRLGRPRQEVRKQGFQSFRNTQLRPCALHSFLEADDVTHQFAVAEKGEGLTVAV